MQCECIVCCPMPVCATIKYMPVCAYVKQNSTCMYMYMYVMPYYIMSINKSHVVVLSDLFFFCFFFGNSSCCIFIGIWRIRRGCTSNIHNYTMYKGKF